MTTLKPFPFSVHLFELEQLSCVIVYTALVTTVLSILQNSSQDNVLQTDSSS